LAPWPDLIAGLALGVVGGTRGKTFPLAILGGLLIAAGGGVVRDLWFHLPLYIAEHPDFPLVAGTGAVLAYRIGGVPYFLVVLLDMIATFYFGVAGTQRGLVHGLSPENAALAGTLSALCGGLAFGLLTLGVKHDSPRPASADMGNESGEASPATHSAP
jgi:uncharacterized membrane protein YeiH